MQESLEDTDEVAEIPARWSVKRIAIASSILLVLAASVYYYFSLKNFNNSPTSVLGASDAKKGNGPEIKIPTKDGINTIISDAKDSLSKIDASNVVASQPEIQKIIKDLQNLTGKDVNAKNMVCDLICKH